MSRARLNSILLVLIVAVGRQSASGNGSCGTSGMAIGIRVPSANNATRWQRAPASGFNHQPLILLEPAGICDLRADGLNGWQKAGVVGSEFLVGTAGTVVPFVPAVFLAMDVYPSTAWLDVMPAIGTWTVGGALLSSTGVWLMGNRAYHEDVAWWKTTLGAGIGTVTSVGLLALGSVVNSLQESGKWRGTFSNVVSFGLEGTGFFGLFLLPPLGAVIGANHR
jgi:hypothetical protein